MSQGDDSIEKMQSINGTTRPLSEIAVRQHAVAPANDSRSGCQEASVHAVNYLEMLLNTFRIEELEEKRFRIRILADVSLFFDKLEIVCDQGDMSLDTVDGAIHLNSRNGTTLKNLPESQAHREKMKSIREAETCPEKRGALEEEIQDMKRRLEELERKYRMP